VLLLSCNKDNTAQIWTDYPEFALYGEYFNTIQDKYKISVRYFEFPAEELKKSNITPDIIVGSWFKNNSTAAYFKALDNIFGAKKLSRSVFYPRFLAMGRIESKQYLLPVSFNIPALIFSKERENDLPNSFTIDFDEIKELGKNYNIETGGVYTRMGFSPLWNDNFLFTTAVLFGSSFRETLTLEWDSQALERSMEFIYNWTHEVNTDNQAEKDFTFKYFFEPPEKLIQSGRIFFSYMESKDIFTLSEASRKNIDFRWITEQESIPITEDMVFLGIPKKSKSTRAARAFIQWFFQIESQQMLLEFCRTNRISENFFGICGGFSALTPVTEQIFPRFYQELLGRMPPSEYFTPPDVLPANWVEIKNRVILPFLDEQARLGNTGGNSLEKRLSDWVRMHH
jgi:ABC-type glycerol-3-phosphate transport system substrate-binding protein